MASSVLRVVGHATAIDGLQLAQVTNVPNRITVDNKHIGKAARCDRAEIVLLTHIPRGNCGHGFDRRHRADRFRKQFDFTQ